MQKRLLVIVAFGLVLLFGRGAALGSAVLRVDRTDDADVRGCTAAASDCTLRGALAVAVSGDTIAFADGVFPGTIAVTSALPEVTQGTVTIDGGSASRVTIDGSGAGAGVNGLTLRSSGNWVIGVTVRGFGGDGIVIDEGGGNHLGISPYSYSPRNYSVLVDNGGYGVRITGEGADGNDLSGTWIGVVEQDPSSFLPNRGGGVRIEGGGDGTRTGWVIGNGGNGVEVVGAGTDGTWIQSDVTSNTGHGVLIDGGSDLFMYYWVKIANNGGDGLRIVSGTGNRVNQDYLYGGFGGNGGLGINLVAPGDPPSGVTPNDPGDGDTGPNGLLNFPVIDGIQGAGGGSYRVNGSTCANCTVRVYDSDNDPSGYGEGRNHLASVESDSSGRFTTIVSLGIPDESRALTATVTDNGGNTSEFARNANVLSSCGIPFNPSDYDNRPRQISGLFVDKHNGQAINQGVDVGGTAHTGLNFTLVDEVTAFDETPADMSPQTFGGSIRLSADILMHTAGTTPGVYRWGGVMALFSEGVGQMGIAVLRRDQFGGGNADTLHIRLVPQSGDVSGGVDVGPVSFRLQPVADDAWYRLEATFVVAGDSLSVTGKLFPRTVPSDPTSDLGPQVRRSGGGSGTISYTGSLSALGLASTGSAGVVSDRSAGLDGQVSVTKLCIEDLP